MTIGRSMYFAMRGQKRKKSSRGVVVQENEKFWRLQPWHRDLGSESLLLAKG